VENGVFLWGQSDPIGVKTAEKRVIQSFGNVSYQNHSPIFAPFSYLPWSFMVVQSRIFRTISAANIEQKSTLAHFSEAGNGEGKNNSGDYSNLKKARCVHGE
jgi:hypothetical protein